MTQITLLDSLLSLIFLLGISSFVYIYSKKLNFPYTVSLVLVGILLVPIIQMGYLGFIKDFSLTPDMLFYIFLPILIFESAYNINYKDLLKSGYSIFSLSVIGLFISVFGIASIIYFVFPIFGFGVPFLVCLLFGSLISATDTVAVLSLFKSIGAPKRLVTIFEGESLFNDGTSLALFLIILSIISSSLGISFDVFSSGVISLLVMIFGGMFFGGFSGFLFSKIIGRIKNNESVEITLTMILAHLTFILSELISKYVVIFGHHIHISGAIATTIAALVMGNYGRYKISAKVSEYMEKFWGFFAFIANSLVFILLGLIVSEVKVDVFSGFIIVIVVAALSGTISRATSVYFPFFILNKLNLEKKIPSSWQHILAWGSPRGALAFMMLLMIPDNLNISGWNFAITIKDFLTLITISTIMFTLFIKVPTVGILIKKLKLDRLNRLEELEQNQAIIIINNKNIKKILLSFEKGDISQKEYEQLKQRYVFRVQNAKTEIQKIIKLNKNNIIQRNISLFALGIQKKYLIELFSYNEVDGNNFKYLLNRIEERIRKLEFGESQIVNFENVYKYNIFEKITNFFIIPKQTDEFIRNRTILITVWKVIEELQDIKEIDFGIEKSYFEEIISIYNEFYKKHLGKEFKNEDCLILENKLFEKSIIKTNQDTIKELKNKGIINSKLYEIFVEKIDDKISADIF